MKQERVLPRSRTAKKRVRQNLKHRLRNRANKTYIKTRVKKFLAAVEQGSLETATTEYRKTAQALDRAARRNIIHPNLAARRKARLAKKLNTLGPTPAENPQG